MADGPTAVFLTIMSLTLTLDLSRWVLARHAIQPPQPPHPIDDVTIVIAVRGGDPLLPTSLSESVANVHPATVLLLVDDDDPAGHAAAAIAAQSPTVQVIRCGPAPHGTNPKVHKQQLAEPHFGPIVAFIDDDTVLPPGALSQLRAALGETPPTPETPGVALVTGIPVYREQGSLWSRLVAAFVNGSATTTYLPLAQLGPPVSINGMIILTWRDSLTQVGGIGAIREATCDDYALALAYRAHQLAIMQHPQAVELATTVPTMTAWSQIMRRWMLFALQVVRHDIKLRVLVIAVLPMTLHWAGLAAAVWVGQGWALAALLAWWYAAALGVWWLRRHLSTAASGVVGVLLHPVAQATAAVFAVVAALGPGTITWRGRPVRVGIGSGPRP